MTDSSPAWESPLVQFGVGAFETLRCQQGAFPLLKWHRERLSRALDMWGLEREKLDRPWQALIEKGKDLSDYPNRRFKLLIGLTENDQLIHHVYDFPFTPNPEPRVLKVESQKIFLPQSFKTSSYEEHYWARRKAASAGVNDVLYVNERKEMLEASTSCLLMWEGSRFIIRDGGPVLASSSLASLRERFPDDFKVVSDFSLELTAEHPLLMMSALNGMAHVGELVEGREKRSLKPLPDGLLEKWNQRLFNTTSQ